MDKKILKEEEAVKSAFSALNPAQIARLVDAFRPDALSKTGVDAATMAEVKKRATGGTSWRCLCNWIPTAGWTNNKMMMMMTTPFKENKIAFQF